MSWGGGGLPWLQTIIRPNAAQVCDANIFLLPRESEPLRFQILTSTCSVFRSPTIADKKEQCTYSPFLFFCAKQKKGDVDCSPYSSTEVVFDCARNCEICGIVTANSRSVVL